MTHQEGQEVYDDDDEESLGNFNEAKKLGRQ